jgi:hypothetical protein
MKNAIFYIIAILICLPSAFSQTDCQDALYNANKLYEQGKMYDAIDLLETCMMSLDSKNDQFEAYRLMAICFENMSAESDMSYYVEKMLTLKPYYQSLPNHDAGSFAQAMSTFKVIPKTSIGFKIGFGTNLTKLKQSYSAYDVAQQYQATLSYDYGIVGRYFSASDMALEAGITLSGARIRHELNGGEAWTKSYTEQLSLLNFTMTAKKYKQTKMKPLSMFYGIKPGLSFFTSSKSQITTKNLSNGIPAHETKSGLADRNTFQPNLGILLGFSRKLTKGTMEFQLEYQLFARTTVKSELRLDNETFVFNTGYINDDVKLNMLNLSMTYTIPSSYTIERVK